MASKGFAISIAFGHGDKDVVSNPATGHSQTLAVTTKKWKMEKDKILTLHPKGKKGVNISIAKYEQIKNFILETLTFEQEITFENLTELAIVRLAGNFDGSVLWYITTVKLDLEARKIIERVPKTSPHKLKIIKNEK